MAAIPDVDRYRPAAEVTVTELWPRIARMADELLERGALGADDARKLAERAEWCW
jgi:hypothetical protein